jgi:hypothetical protein
MALLVAMVLVAGCHTTTVTVEQGKEEETVAASYKFGQLETVLAKDIDTLAAASEKALTALRMPVVSKSHDRLVGRIAAYTSDGKDVTINLAALGDNVTRMTITVGSRWGGGDEVQSRAILQKILESGGWGK